MQGCTQDSRRFPPADPRREFRALWFYVIAKFGHKIKKKLKNSKHKHNIILCDLVSRNVDRIEVRHFFRKTLHKTELPWTKFYDFQAKWARSGPESCNSLSNWAHIGHTRVSWDGTQCLPREFLVSPHEMLTFHFPTAESEFFCATGPKIALDMCWGKFY
jgi:hypothetical protein